MKNLFKRKPHRSSEIPSPSSAAEAAAASCSTEQPATSSAAAGPPSPAEEVRSQPIQVGGGAEHIREDYFSSEEEFQIQLAMALSASNSDYGGSDPDGDQIRKATLLSLGKGQIDQTRVESIAESLSRRYWDYNVIDYHEKVPDGFCDIFMLSPGSSKHGPMPSLSDLQSSIGDLGFEVIVVNHTIDTTLQEIEQIAQCFNLDFQTNETAVLVQRIAELVMDNMGGPVKDATDMLAKWMERSTELRTSLQTSLLPIGCIKVGLSRHRALLFKILADKVGIQCKLVKGSHYTGVDDDAVNIIKLNNEREEYLVDLMAAPGTLIPADILSWKETRIKTDSSNQISDEIPIPILNSNSPLIIPSQPSISTTESTSTSEFIPNPLSNTGSTSSYPLVLQTEQLDDSRNLFAELNPFGRSPSPIPDNRPYNNNNNNNDNGAYQRRRENVSPGPSRPHQQPLVMKNWSAFNDTPFPRRNNNNNDNNNNAASSSSASQRPPLKSPNVNNNNNNNNVKVQYNNNINNINNNNNLQAGFGGGNYVSEKGQNNGRNEKKSMNELNIVSTWQTRSSRLDAVFDDVSECEILWEDLVIGERIGLGSYGEVYRSDWNGTEVAVKKFLDQDFYGGALDEFRSEVRIMRRLRHPNVVRFMGAVTRPPHLSIVSEFLPRGSLYRLLHRANCQIDEKRRIRMALDVAKGMSCLHTSVPIIVHRDLKSPNLLVDNNWTVKVCDFGLSRLKHSTFLSSRSTAGTPEWMAPEVLRNEPSHEKCDVYSFGVILWELATLRMPWTGMNPMQVVGAVGFQDRRLDIPKEVDPLAATIMKQCWQTDPNARPSFAELTTHLKALQRLVIPSYQMDASSSHVHQEIYVNSPTP